MAKRKNNKILIFTGIAIMLVLIALFYFGTTQTYFPYNSGLIQKGMSLPSCSAYDGYSYGADSSINLAGHKYVFKTLSQVAYLGPDSNSYSAYTYIPSSDALFSYSTLGYAFNIHVYRDDIKIDEILLPANIPTSGPLPIYRGYGIDGTIYNGELPSNVNGINAVFGYRAGVDGCSRATGARRMYFNHKFVIVYPLSLDIKLMNESSSGSYFKLTSNKNTTIKMSYTLLGSTNEVREETITLVQGENTKLIGYTDQKEIIRFTFKEIIPSTDLSNLNYISDKILNEVPKYEQGSVVYDISKYSSISKGEEVTELISLNVPTPPVVVTPVVVPPTTQIEILNTTITGNIIYSKQINAICWESKNLVEMSVIGNSSSCSSIIIKNSSTCNKPYYSTELSCNESNQKTLKSFVLGHKNLLLIEKYGITTLIVFVLIIFVSYMIRKKPKKSKRKFFRY